MSSTFSSRLRLELIGAGEQSGAWNNTTNTNLGTLIDEAIAGVAPITLNSTTYTLDESNGASDEARQAVLVFSGTPGGVAVITCPTVEKTYIIKNSTSGGNKITVKTAAGGSPVGVDIPNGSTAVVYTDGVDFFNAVKDLAADATVDGVAITTISGTQTLTNKTLTAPKFADGGFIADANGNEIVVLDTVSSAVNEITVANAATGAGPSISATGSDSNIDLLLAPKGTGVTKSGGVEVVTLTGTQALSNKTIVSPANISATTGNAAIVAATGPDTDININLTPKGSGVVNTTTVATFAAGTVSAPSIAASGDTDTGIWFPAANTIAFSTSGTEDFRIGSSGQLGIGGANYGTAGQVLVSGGASAAPAWTTTGSAAPDVIIQDQKSSGTVGGTGTSGSWQTRTLNTLVRNNNSIASLSSNQFTLPAGTYYIKARSPLYYVGGFNRIRLYNVTDATTAQLGYNQGQLSGNSPDRTMSIDAPLETVITIAGSKTFRIDYYAESFSKSTTENLGVANSLGTEIYTSVSIWKL